MLGLGLSLAKPSRRSAPSLTQALVASFTGTGLLDELWVFDPDHYSVSGGIPGVFTDALNGKVYNCPTTAATFDVEQDASGYWVAKSDGIDDTAISDEAKTVAYYTAVFRSPPGQTTWSGFAGPLESTTDYDTTNIGYFSSGSTHYDAGHLPRAVWRDGMELTSPFDLAPITTWQMVTVSCRNQTISRACQMFALQNMYFLGLQLAALGLRYSDPTSDQQNQIESKFVPVRDALIDRGTLAAHIAALKAIDPSGKYLLSDPTHYSASLSQAGRFVDAFGSAFAYDSPNVEASPTAVQDPMSGLWYDATDGGDDTAIGSANEAVSVWTGLWRSPPGQTTFSNYGPPIDEYHFTNGDQRIGILNSGTTEFYTIHTPPRRVRRNGVELDSPFDHSPVTNWGVTTLFSNDPSSSVLRQFCAVDSDAASFYSKLHKAALRIWPGPTDPTDEVIAATEAEIARYFASLIATNP